MISLMSASTGELLLPPSHSSFLQGLMFLTGQFSRNSTGFDLWEEVSGSSFFTLQNHYRSLVQGAELANTIGLECSACGQAPQIACFLQTFWNGGYFIANLNVDNGRTGKDASTILGPIAVFDVNATCDSPSLQPCHSRSLANFKVFIDSFRSSTVTPINDGIPVNQGIAVGRYPEDVYFGGNPWLVSLLVRRA